MPIPSPEERVGTVVGDKYQIERILGRGGMGIVFQGMHRWTDRPVAIKLLHPHLTADAAVARRFLREGKSAAALRHPHVVDVLDMGQTEDGAVYMVLELLEGQSLHEALDEQQGPLPVKQALEHSLPIMEGLAYAHASGVVHRDLKPDNIFLARDARGRLVPKLLDFGIAKVAHAEGTHTASGTIVGTPAYMSPEQVRGLADVGPASDVWSMGVVLFELLSGELPFVAETVTGILAAILTNEAPMLRDVAPSLPRPIADAVQQALRRDPSERHPSMAAFATALLAAARRSDLEIDHDGAWIGAFAATADVRAPAAPREDETPTSARAEGAVSGSLEQAPAPAAEPAEEENAPSRAPRSTSLAHAETLPTPVTIPPLPRPRPRLFGAAVAGLIVAAALAAAYLGVEWSGPGQPRSEPAPPTEPSTQVDVSVEGSDPPPPPDPIPRGIAPPEAPRATPRQVEADEPRERPVEVAPPAAPATERTEPRRGIRVRAAGVEAALPDLAREPRDAPAPEEHRGANDALILR